MLSLYALYRKYCPGSRLTEGQVSESAMRMAIEVGKANAKKRREDAVAPPAQSDVDRYETWKASRAIRSAHQLDFRIRQRIIEALTKYEALAGPVRQLYLSGSYTAGSWIDEDTPDEERALRRMFKFKSGVSDIDVRPEPYHGARFYNGVDFSGWSKPHDLLIYENGTFLWDI